MKASRLQYVLPTLCLFISGFGDLRARDTTTVDFQFWSDFTLVHHFNETWRYSGDQGIRGLFTNKNWTQIYVRPTVIWRFSPVMDARAGISLFQTCNKDLPNQTEVRFHQETNLKWPYVVGFVFKHILRFEERFFFNQGFDNQFSLSFDDVINRYF